MSIKLALGTVQFGLAYGIANRDGQVNQATIANMLKEASLSGIDTLDTAIAYGDSELCLGKAGIEDFKVITKLPAIPHLEISTTWINKQLNASFARLKTTKVYALLLHRPEQLLEENGFVLYQALEKLKQENKVKKIGISVYNPSELIAIMERYPIDLVQIPFNLVDRRLLQADYLAQLKQNGVEVHVRSVFLQGLLLMPKAAIPAKFSPWEGIWTKWHTWLQENNISALQACLSFPLGFSEIDRVVIGADNLMQLREIIAITDNLISLDDLPDLSIQDEKLINPSLW